MQKSLFCKLAGGNILQGVGAVKEAPGCSSRFKSGPRQTNKKLEVFKKWQLPILTQK